MALPRQRIRIVAGSPIEVGEQRLLPSVLVSTMEAGDTEQGIFRSVKMRPISIVSTGPQGTRWHKIPNATSDKLSVMIAIGLGVALFSLFVLMLNWWMNE